MSRASKEKRETTYDRRNGIMKRRNIRTLGEKEIHKYFGILEVDTIKQVKIREKVKKEYLMRTKSYSRQNYKAETISKG